MSKLVHLFAYGTLQSFSDQPLAKKMRATAANIQAAQVRGRLYKIDYYPGLVLDDSGDWIPGELFSFTENDFSKLIDPLDHYEACHERDPQPHEYKRIQTSITLTENRQRETAWIYEFIQDISKFPKIDSFGL